MSKAQHTQGPWVFKNEEDHENSDCTRTIVQETRHGDIYLADVRRTAADSDEQADANARIIAAAPDLLEALEFLLGTSSALHRETDEVGWSSVLQARAAIAKAKGE